MNDYPINHLICCPQEKMVNHCGAHSSSLFVQVEADFNQLRLCLDILLNFGHALLKELLAMHKTVSWSYLHLHFEYISNAVSFYLSQVFHSLPCLYIKMLPPHPLS